MIRPTLTYVFETECLKGEIRADTRKPGVIQCRHKPTKFDVLPEVPFQALLMPEWLLRPANRREGIFWAPCNARPEVFLDGDGVVFHVSAEQTRDWNMELTFHYLPGPDWIDFRCEIVPGTAIDGFEFFFASYISEEMESTWVPAAMPDGESWQKFDNRKPERRSYWVARDERARGYLNDGRWNYPGKEAGAGLRPQWCYARPILVAMQESAGLAAVTMVEPEVCSLLAGAHHTVETAHDFTFGGHLQPKEPLVGRARIVIREIGSFPQAKENINRMWRDFTKSLR